MKIKIEIDCTPEEARGFFGLPDLQPLHGKVMAEVEKQVLNSMSLMEPEAILKTWLPMGVQGFDTMQKLMWEAATGKPQKSKPSPGGKAD